MSGGVPRTSSQRTSASDLGKTEQAGFREKGFSEGMAQTSTNLLKGYNELHNELRPTSALAEKAKMIALQKACRAGSFNPCHLAYSLLAGVIAGIVALPLAMAFAIASGAKTAQGIDTANAAGF